MRRYFGLLGIGGVALAVAYGCGDDGESFSGAPAEEGGAGGATGAGGQAGTGGGTGAAGGPATGGGTGQGGSPGVAGAAGAPAAGGPGAAGEPGVAGAPGTAGEPGLAGAAGAAGAGCSNLDADNDGQSECEGDCDDQDPLNWDGNSELCGDLADNNCDQQADEVCGELGTFVSAATGVDPAPGEQYPVSGNPGTMDAPVQTIAQGMTNAQTIMATTGGSIDVYVAQGTYAEKVVMAQGINLLGGFDCPVQPCSWSRDPTQYISEIVNQDMEGVLADDTISRVTRFDGFTATGLGGAAVGGTLGSAGLTLNGGSPTITNNIITGGDLTGGDWNTGRSSGILQVAPTNDVQGTLIDSNTITGGTSAQQSIGITMVYAPGLWRFGNTYAVITRNTISGGSGRNVRGISAWATGAGTLIRNNDIFAGDSTVDGGSAWGIEGGGTLEIDANRINADTANPPTCVGGNWCGGIFSESMTATITNNVVFGAASENSAAVLLTEMEAPVGTVSLNSNYLDAAGDASSATSTSAALAFSRQQNDITSQFVLVGRVINNILVAGQADTRYGIYERETWATKEIHPEALQNNDFYIDTPDGNDFYYLLFDGSVQHTLDLITDINALNANGFVPVVTSGNFDNDLCVDSTFHLQAGSACVDNGVATEAPPMDFEGDSRPQGQGYDVGPDEVLDTSTP